MRSIAVLPAFVASVADDGGDPYGPIEFRFNIDGAFADWMKPDNAQADRWSSRFHVAWPTHIEETCLTSDVDPHAPEPPEFHETLASEVIRGWKHFKDVVAPSLPKNHFIRQQLDQKHAGALNDAFFHYQKQHFEDGAAKSVEDPNTTWPELDQLPEYRRLRQYVNRLSRRYLIRSGVDPAYAQNLDVSIFNWWAVNRKGEFHGPHTHVGEYHVAVFYAKVPPEGGKLRLSDPRGHQPPFGKEKVFTVKSGTLMMFPSWLTHMATATVDNDAEDPDNEPRVICAFNIGPLPGPLPCHMWNKDPTSGIEISRKADVEDWVLNGGVGNIPEKMPFRT